MRNWNSLFYLILLVALVAAFGSRANAQYEPLGTGLSVRAGAFFPSDASARDAEGATWLTVGAEWRFFKLPSVNPLFKSNLTLSADWYGSGSLYAIPVLANYSARMDKFLFSVGLGLAFDQDLGGSVGTDLAWAASVGMEFLPGPTPIYGALRYNGSGADGLNGLSAVVGVRF
ncbi:MAG: hypothetical protein WCO51_04375 [bacterium]